MSEFAKAVRKATKGTPYRVIEKPDGFELRLDVADQRWSAELAAAGIEAAHCQRVHEFPGGRFSIADEYHRVDWTEEGRPSVAAQAQGVIGQLVVEAPTAPVWGVNSKGKVRRIGDLRFDSEEGRQLIGTVADQLELRPRLSAGDRLGLMLAGAAIAVVALLVVLGLSGHLD